MSPEDTGACGCCGLRAFANGGRLYVLYRGAGGTLAAWQTEEQVYFDAVGSEREGPTPAPGQARSRKHPVLAARSDGMVLLAWTEGTSWARGGALAWQIFDSNRRPVGSMGRSEGIPVWSMPAAFVDERGDFLLVY